MKLFTRVTATTSVIAVALMASGCGGGQMSPRAPAVTLSANSLSFPDEAPGTASATQAVSVRNSGTAPLQITGISIGTNFQEIDDCGSQVAVGAQCTINVTFVPTTTGNLLVAVTIADNAPGNPHIITLTGQGVNTGPPPQPTLTGYCYGSFALTNQCGVVKDVTSCPVGQVASHPESANGCWPPSTQFWDSSTSCQGKTSTGLTVKGSCLVAW
jgi:hypothetical protein